MNASAGGDPHLLETSVEQVHVHRLLRLARVPLQPDQDAVIVRRPIRTLRREEEFGVLALLDAETLRYRERSQLAQQLRWFGCIDADQRLGSRQRRGIEVPARRVSAQRRPAREETQEQNAWRSLHRWILRRPAVSLPLTIKGLLGSPSYSLGRRWRPARSRTGPIAPTDLRIETLLHPCRRWWPAHRPSRHDPTTYTDRGTGPRVPHLVLAGS